MSVGTTSPESARASSKRYSESSKGRQRIKFKRAVETAVRNGTLKKPSKCPKCGRSGIRILFHHPSYAPGKELTGSWQCDKCHGSTEQRSGTAQRKARAKAEATKARHGTYHKDGSKTK